MAEYSPLGSISASRAFCAKVVSQVHLCVSADYYGNGAKLCCRRFFYVWKRPIGSGSWEQTGLCMTDDQGMLFEIEPFLEAIGFGKNHKVHKYNPAKKAFNDETWSLYGDAEDILALQQHLSDPSVGRDAKKTDLVEKAFGETSLFIRVLKNGETIFQNPFVVQDEHLLSFSRGMEYYLMFYPPHVVGRSMLSEEQITLRRSGSCAPAGPPPDLFYDNVYMVENTESVATVCSKLGLGANFDLAGYKDNRRGLDSTKKRFKAGALLAVPPHCCPSHGFGKSVVLESLGKAVIPDSKWFTVNASGAQVSRSAPTLMVELPVTLEEHTARLAEDHAMLDMIWSVLIEAAKPFAEASHKARAMAELISIMHRYPGFKKREELNVLNSKHRDNESYVDSVIYSGREIFEQHEIDVINDAYHQAVRLENELMAASFNDQNPVFQHERDGFYALIETIERHLNSPRLLAVLGQWGAQIQYGTESTFPYLFARDTAPYFFEVLSKTFQTLLSIRAPYPTQHSDGEARTVGDAIYENILSRFEAELQGTFHVKDAGGAVQKQVSDALKAAGLVGVDVSSVFDTEVYVPLRNEYKGEFLSFIFSDVILDKGITGLDGCVETILRAGSEFRTKMIRIECQRRGIRASFAAFKIAAGLQFRLGKSPASTVTEAKKSISHLANERKRYTDLSKNVSARHNRHTETIQAPAEFTFTAQTAAAGIALYSLFHSVARLRSSSNNGTSFSFDDLVEFASSLRSVGAAAAGLTSNILKTTDAVLEMQELLQNSVELQAGVTAKAKVAGYLDSTKKALGRTTVIFSVYGLYKDLEKTMQAGRSGDSVEHSLRWIQIGIRATSIAAGFVPGGVLVSLALESGNLAITGYITLRESLKLGVESVIGQINNQLANGELFRKNHRELVTNRKYYLSSDSLYVSHRLGEQQYRIGSTLHATLRDVQDAFKMVRFVNVDPVSGGAVLYNRGYSISDIAFITAKQQRLRPVEVNFIEGFGHAGVFDLRDWAARMPTTQYRFPNEDYYSNRDIKGMWGSSTEHWLYYAPVSYFKEHYPATEVAFTQY